VHITLQRKPKKIFLTVKFSKKYMFKKQARGFFLSKSAYHFATKTQKKFFNREIFEKIHVQKAGQ